MPDGDGVAAADVETAETKSAVFALQPVSVKSWPVNGASGGGAKPGPPQLAAPCVFVNENWFNPGQLHGSGHIVVVVVEDVVVVVAFGAVVAVTIVVVVVVTGGGRLPGAARR